METTGVKFTETEETFLEAHGYKKEITCYGAPLFKKRLDITNRGGDKMELFYFILKDKDVFSLKFRKTPIGTRPREQSGNVVGTGGQTLESFLREAKDIARGYKMVLTEIG